jgi:hypothetical protein
MAYKFEIYKDKAGEFRFRFKAPNGEIMFGSEGYKAKASRRAPSTPSRHTHRARPSTIRPNRVYRDASRAIDGTAAAGFGAAVCFGRQTFTTPKRSGLVRYCFAIESSVR